MDASGRASHSPSVWRLESVPGNQIPKEFDYFCFKQYNGDTIITKKEKKSLLILVVLNLISLDMFSEWSIVCEHYK